MGALVPDAFRDFYALVEHLFRLTAKNLGGQLSTSIERTL